MYWQESAKNYERSFNFDEAAEVQEFRIEKWYFEETAEYSNFLFALWNFHFMANSFKKCLREAP